MKETLKALIESYCNAEKLTRYCDGRVSLVITEENLDKLAEKIAEVIRNTNKG